MNKPKILVFMAAYNAASYIADSIKSILNQTFTDFELLILNDGSTDATVEVVEGFDDKRIRLVHNQENKGLMYTRNRLKEFTDAPFIAILDSDDLARPDRLALQYHFLKQNPEIALCGGHAEIIDEKGVFTGQKYIEPTDQTVAMYMLFGNPFINSSTMFKTSVFTELGGYRDYAPSEDFDLFVRISEKHAVANIDQILVNYRIHSNNTSTTHSEVQKKNERRIIRNMQASLGMLPNEQLEKLHIELFNQKPDQRNLNEYLRLFETMKTANAQSLRYNQQLFNGFLFDKWNALIRLQPNNKKALQNFFKNELFEWSYFKWEPFKKALKISLKSLFY